MAPQEGTNPGLVDLTTPDYAKKCGMCHPGGGPMEKDRNDVFLHQKALSEIQADFEAGKIPGDYATFGVNPETQNKEFLPFEWKLEVNGQKVNNTMAPTCFYCHSKKLIESWDTAATGTLKFRTTLNGKAVGKPYFAAADAVGGGIASVNATDLTITYINNGTIGDDVIGSATDKHCGHCHGSKGFEDINNDGVNPLDFVIQVKDLKFMHPDFMKEALVWQFAEDSKNIDVHKVAGKGCVECHQPVSHEYIGDGYFPSSTTLVPSHDFAKGSCGPAFSVMWNQVGGSLTCEKCHEDAANFHSAYFGPAAGIHIDKVACTTCHIGKKYFYRVKLIDWSLPMFVVTGNADSITFWGLDKHGYLYGDPVNGKYEDIAWLPERDFETGEVKWKIKPVNAMGVLLFEDNSSGEFKPVLARYLAKAFKVNPNLPTKYMKVEVDPSTGQPKYSPATTNTGETLSILNIKVVKGGIIADDEDLNSGNYTLWRAIPNYIDVDLDGNYTEGVDVQITDDTGLTGTTDGDPELNTKEEVEAAINTLKKVIVSATGKENVEVKLVATTDAFGMSHNIRPAEEALTCGECHGTKATELEGPLFTSTTPLYFPYDAEVENATYFDKKIDRAPTLEDYAEHIKAELIEAGYGEETTTAETELSTVEVPEEITANVSETNATIEIPSENVEIKVKVENATIDTSDVPDTKDELLQVVEALSLPEETKVIAAIKVVATSTFTVEFDITGLDPAKLTVTTDKGSVINKEVSGNTLFVTIDPNRADNTVTVALVEEPLTADSSTSSGGGGGCSMTPSAGLGGAISGLLGLLPLAFLRRRKEN